MLKRVFATGALAGLGLMVFSASPAVADGGHTSAKGDGNPTTVQLIAIQTCRSIDVAGVGAAIHNLLGDNYDHGDCINGSTVGSGNANRR